MSHMTRKEIVDLQTRFVERERSLPGYTEGANTGTQLIAKALAKDTAVPVSLSLRNFGRVLKHYLDEARNPKQADRVFPEFNKAVAWSARAMSHDQAIRRARVEVSEERNPELVRQRQIQKEKQQQLLEDNRKRMEKIQLNADYRPATTNRTPLYDASVTARLTESGQKRLEELVNR